MLLYYVPLDKAPDLHTETVNWVNEVTISETANWVTEVTTS